MRTELAPLVPGVTAAGLNEQLSPVGRPEQVRATELLNDPDLGATLTLKLPKLPELMVTEDGLAPIVNPAFDPEPVPDPEPDPEPEPEFVVLLQVRVALTPLEIRFVMLGFATACTKKV